MIPFFGDLCQRGREHEPKAKGPHHHQFQKIWFSIGTNFRKSSSIGIFQIGISLCSKEEESSIYKINILKPS
jgi:hypothetical protein